MSCLFYTSQPLNQQITRDLLAQFLAEHPNALLSIEPQARLPIVEGRPKPGRLAGFKPLGQELPPEGLAIQEAAIYAAETWILLAAPQEASGWHGRKLVWSLNEFAEAQTLEGLRVEQREILPWQDTGRFGIEKNARCQTYHTESYFLGSELLTWRLVPEVTKGEK